MTTLQADYFVQMKKLEGKCKELERIIALYEAALKNECCCCDGIKCDACEALAEGKRMRDLHSKGESK